MMLKFGQVRIVCFPNLGTLNNNNSDDALTTWQGFMAKTALVMEWIPTPAPKVNLLIWHRVH